MNCFNQVRLLLMCRRGAESHGRKLSWHDDLGIAVAVYGTNNSVAAQTSGPLHAKDLYREEGMAVCQG